MDDHEPVGFTLGKDLDEALGIAVGSGARIGRKRELAGAVGDPCNLEFLLCLAYGGDLRPSVDDGRYCIVVDLRLLAREAFGEGDAFLFGLVREHWAADNISDRVNT